MVSLEEMALVFAFLIIFSIISYKKRLLNNEGIIIANAIGIAAILYGPNRLTNFIAVAVFFIIAEFAGIFQIKKHETRNIRNLVGNALPALIMLFMINFFPNNQALFELAFFGAVSAALADTLASEIGFYSKKAPILITSLKKVKPGVDGGITLLGELAALMGGVAIALIHFFIYRNIALFFIIILAAMFGTNIDSLFGATYERKKIIGNTTVNFIGSISGAFFAILFGIFLL